MQVPQWELDEMVERAAAGVATDDDEGEAVDDVDESGGEDEDADDDAAEVLEVGQLEPEPVPLLRSRGYKPSHRHAVAKTEKPTGTSSWLNAPRDGFTAQQAGRAKDLSATKQGVGVKGTTREY